MTRFFLRNLSICFFNIIRGDASTGLLFILKSDANHPTSLFHGNIIKLSGSGIANMSVSAGVISSQVANPANPAPFFCISLIAGVGTSFDLKTPKRSTKLIKKYLIFFCFAINARFFAIK